uniref:TIR domain-containing protein n=1 Tax=Amphimedon queenslandica TaxID=400682 RepID=A0A1X7VQS0_AMPQE
MTALQHQSVMSSSLSFVAVYLTKDTSPELAQQLGCLLIKAPGPQAVALTLRESINQEISSLLLPKSYSFITPQGWELEEILEGEFPLQWLICDKYIARIRARQDRVWIHYDDKPFCSVSLEVRKGVSLLDVKEAIEIQHPGLYGYLLTKGEGGAGGGVRFLDINGCPVSQTQEHELPLSSIVLKNTISLTSFSVPSSHPSIALVPSKKRTSIALPQAEGLPLNQTSSNTDIVGRRSPSFPRKSIESLEIMLSYVHKEASGPAARLSEELSKLGYTVFLDKTAIKPGDDWQDVLNEAVCNCRLFIPLVTPLYGLTEWTNREVKLADTLGKMIIPVTFLSTWPPMCLAIQFATTQFIKWNVPSSGSHFELNTIINTVAVNIADQYSAMKSEAEAAETSKEDEETQDDGKRDEINDTNNKKELSPPLSTASRKSKSFPRSLPEMIRKSIFKQDPSKATPLIVVSYHPTQLEFLEGLRHDLESRGHEVWASMAGEDLRKRETFKKKVNVSSVVVFILSAEYVKSSSCEQEMYYVEGRKRIIPIMVDSFQIPGWMTTLVGPDSFLDSRSPNFQDAFREEIESATVPAKAEERLRKLVEQKTQLHKLCTDLKKRLPKGRLVYVTGSSKIASKNGLAICREFGQLLASEKHDYYLVTGGFYGVGNAIGESFYKEIQKRKGESGGYVIHIQAKRDPQDHTVQARQNTDGTFQPLPYGDNLFYCESVRQREMLTPKVIDLCILIEGGPSAAFEAHQFSWSGHTVIPVVSTGGAAGGKFNAPPGIFYKPNYASESDWSVLSDLEAEPKAVARALVNIVASHNWSQ